MVVLPVFDHTSLIRFISGAWRSTRFGIEHHAVAPRVCGDLSSAFNFERADERGPQLRRPTPAATREGSLAACGLRAVPGPGSPCRSRSGLAARPRACRTSCWCHGHVEAGSSFSIDFRNTGRPGAAFYVNRVSAPTAVDLHRRCRPPLSDTWVARRIGGALRLFGAWPERLPVRIQGVFPAASDESKVMTSTTQVEYLCYESKREHRAQADESRQSESRLDVVNAYGRQDRRSSS